MQFGLWIIAAPSCVGKTTFIKENTRIAEITGLEKAPLIEAHCYKQYLPITNSTYLHCCVSKKSDLNYTKVIHLPTKAIILLSSIEMVKERARKRTEAFINGEDVARPPCREHITPEIWKHIYIRAISQLEEADIPITFLNTNVPSYPIVPKQDILKYI